MGSNPRNKVGRISMKDMKLRTIVFLMVIVMGLASVYAIKSGKTGLNGVGANGFELATLDLEELKKEGLPIIINFSSNNCQPCITLKPILAAMSKEYEGKAIIKMVDTEKHPEIAKLYPIKVVPSQILIKADGKPYVPTEGNYNYNMQFYGIGEQEHALTVHEGGLDKKAYERMLLDMGMTQ